MNVHIVNLTGKGFRLIGKEICLKKIAVMGFAVRKNINNSRESPVNAITEELVEYGDDMRVFDPFMLSHKTGSAMFFPDYNHVRENQPWLSTEHINFANPVDGKNLFTGGQGRYI
jgi:UDP-N-acetyl-D-mannosaminuronate dehydrogenase